MSTEDEVFKVRERMHKLADTVQAHEITLKEHEIKIDLVSKQVTTLTMQTATREQLDAAVIALGTKLTSSVELMTLQIRTIVEDLAPIRKGIYWVVTLVLGAVILAGLSFLFRRP